MKITNTGHERIASRVRAGRSTFTRELTARGFLRILTLAVGGSLAGILLHLVFRLGTPLAWGLSMAVLFLCGLAVVRFLVFPLLKRPPESRFVEWLDSRSDAGKNIIVSAYQLGGDASARTMYSADLVDAIVERGSTAALRVDIGHWTDRSGDRRWWAAMAGALALAGVLVLAAGSSRVGGALGKVLNPTRAALPPVGISVRPGDVTVERGEDVDLAIAITGTDQPPLLRVRETGGIWMTRLLKPEADRPGGVGPIPYGALIRRVERDHEYQVVLQKTESPVWRISVNEPPRVIGFEMTYYYPEYTGREAETVTGGTGDLTALAGTKVLLKVLTNRRMASAVMKSGPAGAERLETAAALDPADMSNWEARFTMSGETREYTVTLHDPGGAERVTTPRFRIEAVPDRAPLVRLLSPDRDMPIPESMRLPLEAEGLDDFGLTRLDLVYDIRDGDKGRLRLRDFSSTPPELHATFEWDLVPLHLLPGHEVSYFLELFDNDRVSGPKAGRSETRRLRFPTMDEIYAEVQNEHQEQIDDLSSVLSGSRELKEKLDRLSRETKRGDEMSWEKKKEIQDLLDRQSDLEKKIDETARELSETLDKAQEQTLLSPELLQKMQELTELVQSIENKKLKESFQKLNEALQKMDREAVERALEDMKLDQEQMVKNLEKTIELLKEIRKEEMLEDVVRKSQELAEEQRDLSREIEKEGEKGASEKNEHLAEKQDELGEKADELSKQIQDLAKLAENEPKLQEELENSEKSGQQQEMKENMEQSENELQKGQKNEALNFAFKAAEQAQNMASSMKKAQSESNAAKKKELQEKLLKVIQDLVDLSSAQEDLLAQAPATREGELAARQRVLMDGTLKAALELEALGKRTLFVNQEQTSKLGSAMSRMGNATRSYSQGNRNNGLREGKESAGDLNEAIVELMQSHSSMCQSGSPSGFMESMQKMAGLTQQQQDLNNATQSLGGSMGSQPRLSRSQAEQLEQMAAQQEMIRRGLEDVAGKIDGRKDVLGRLDDLAREMGEVAEEMKKQNVDDRLLERQQKILSRLLDAQKSIRKKDDENERESKTADQLARKSPGPLSPEQMMGPERLRSDILRGQSDNYPAQFRALVEKYFKALSGRRAEKGTSGKAGE